MEYDDMHQVLKKLKSERRQNEFETSDWANLPENVLIKIFSLLSAREILNCSECCRRWHYVSRDTLLWRSKFREDFKVERGIKLKPNTDNWYNEYKRLVDNVPLILTEVLTEHSHQVLHVSFSNNGKLFSTCSKDGFVIVWTSDFPSQLKHKYDMKTLSWKYTQFSQWNRSDSLLLVSGVHFGSFNSTSGEIAVFSLADGFHLRARVQSKPYDIFGCWLSNQHILSGDLKWLAHLVSKSTIWISKANQEIDNENVPVMKEFLNFYNRNASSIRNLMIARCPWLDDVTPPPPDQSSSEQSTSSQSNNQTVYQPGNPMSNLTTRPPVASGSASVPVPDASNSEDNFGYDRPFNYSDEFRKELEENFSESSSELDDFIDVDMAIDEEDVDDDLYEPKYLIFSTGSKTYTPHQIGFKRVLKTSFPKKLEPGPPIKERIALQKRRRELQQIIEQLSPEEARLQFQHFPELRADPDWANFDSVSSRFDGVDALIDLEGHIIGMGLSPDHRFLYVNSRPWPQNCVISNPLEPPPISQEIDIHVIDLQTLKKVGTMLRAHKAYTPNTECFFIFLDVCDDFVGSGAEDRHAYLWDRYYGMCLASFPHNDVVNSVAFNPKDNEMFISTSDDYEIKIWRSQASIRERGIAEMSRANEIRLKNIKKKGEEVKRPTYTANDGKSIN
ncbi:F-box/WD repeat-containing protein 5-like [Chironomus tepperi]|uniref:F-box/WD repeat-containing protein 5-like n=1 Tax=Chironomus tepperi TaxID=113505 RepID=UPI00391FBD81